MRPPLLVPAALLAALLATACASGRQARAPTPQRPTFSSNTSTTAEGTVEIEAGVGWDPSDSTDVPVTLKYGFHEATELFVSTSPYVQRSNPDHEGIGDLVLGMRHRFYEDEDEGGPSLAWLASMKLPTADDTRGPGTGEVDATFAGIASGTSGDANLTLYYQLDVLGSQAPRVGTELSHSLAFAADIPFDDNVGGFAEIFGVVLPESDVEDLFGIVGLTFAAGQSTIFDAAIRIPLDESTPDETLIFGLTHNFGARTGSERLRNQRP